MADISNEDLKNLILSKFTELDKKIDQLDKKMDVGFAEMDNKINVGFAELRGEIKEIRGEIKTLDTKFTGEIKSLDQKFTGEIKNLETKIEGFNARIGFQEFVSRSLLVGILVTFTVAAIKFALLPGNPFN